MYSTCLFCHSSLGSNQRLEQFPVGRRLAFDSARGRLWVICPRCARWNLSPLEERWEVQEECERLFRDTRLRYCTEQIGMARLPDGLELVRIGEPLRPEMAAWRYGRVFGRRMRRTWMLAAGSSAAVLGVAIAGPFGFVVGGLGVASQLSLSLAIYAQNIRTAVRLPTGDGATIDLTLNDLIRTRLKQDGWDWYLELDPRVRRLPFAPRLSLAIRDEEAIRTAGIILARVNRGTGRARTVEGAVRLLEESRSADDLFRTASKFKASGWASPEPDAVVALPASMRLALEMAGNEETEREAMEGELWRLEDAWKQAEEIAAIADNLLLPASLEEKLGRLRSRLTSEPAPPS